MPLNIFIVEDEESLAKTLALNLRIENYSTQIATTGKKALEEFNKHSDFFSLVLLDVMLPDISGYDLCKKMKAVNPDIPIIFLTAKNQTGDKIEGLKLGADDYITKPFDLEEVLLRINNLLKRSQKQKTKQFKFNSCEINFSTFEVLSVSGDKITLSKREIGLLELLVTNANKVISRDEIIDKLWDLSDNASSRTIDNYILNFRKYFESQPKEPKHFLSIRGVGYKFVSE